jgi:hypothetical protein
LKNADTYPFPAIRAETNRTFTSPKICALTNTSSKKNIPDRRLTDRQPTTEDRSTDNRTHSFSTTLLPLSTNGKNRLSGANTPIKTRNFEALFPGHL